MLLTTYITSKYCCCWGKSLVFSLRPNQTSSLPLFFFSFPSSRHRRWQTWRGAPKHDGEVTDESVKEKKDVFFFMLETLTPAWNSTSLVLCSMGWISQHSTWDEESSTGAGSHTENANVWPTDSSRGHVFDHPPPSLWVEITLILLLVNP